MSSLTTLSPNVQKSQKPIRSTAFLTIKYILMSINSILIVCGVAAFTITLATDQVLMDEKFPDMDRSDLRALVLAASVWIVMTQSIGLLGVIKEDFRINLIFAILSVLEILGNHDNIAVVGLAITALKFTFCAMIKKADIKLRNTQPDKVSQSINVV